MNEYFFVTGNYKVFNVTRLPVLPIFYSWTLRKHLE